MTLSTGQILNNRYRIVKLLGQGGFGAVYRAWDLNLNMPVALKENLNISPASVRQFTTEARLLASLRHPNLPYVIDHFILPDQGQYLVMEFIEGQDLQDMLNESATGLPESQVIPWIEQICDALTYLHSQTPPIIHRDIKPANLKVNPQGQIKLVDFGVSKQFNPQKQTTVGARAVTFGYSPPEQYGHGITDARSDVYALAATLYASLTGHIPPESLQRRIGEGLTPPRQLNPAISAKTDRAILQAMNLSPNQRFQSVAEFKAGLAKPAPSTPITAVQPARRQDQAQYEAGTVRVDQTPSPPPIQQELIVPTPRPAETPPGHARPKAWSAPQAPRKSRGLTGMAIGAFLAVCLILGVGSVLGYYYLFPGSDNETDTPLSVAIDKTNTAIAAIMTQTAEATTAEPSPTWTAIPSDTAGVTPSATISPTDLPTASTTPIPSRTPTATPTKTPVYDTWQPCAGSYLSRLRIGDKAYISYEPPLPNRVRSEANTSSEILGYLQVGEEMVILDGPVCAESWVWWYVRSLDTGLTGWTAEGDFENYWLVPLE